MALLSAIKKLLKTNYNQAQRRFTGVAGVLPYRQPPFTGTNCKIFTPNYNNMKTMLHQILDTLFTSLLLQIANNFNIAPVEYSFQPLPSYWEMNPCNKLINVNSHRN